MISTKSKTKGNKKELINNKSQSLLVQEWYLDVQLCVKETMQIKVSNISGPVISGLQVISSA